MDKIYTISDIRFEEGFMIIRVDDSEVKVRISEASRKLDQASEKERLDYRISPSGYGIHWRGLDEDLSINGLMKLAKKHELSNL
jgi:hypothetical protein